MIRLPFLLVPSPSPFVCFVTLLFIAGPEAAEKAIPPFDSDEEPAENQQSKEYTQYFKDNIKLLKTMALFDANRMSSLLSYRGPALPFRVNGTADVFASFEDVDSFVSTCIIALVAVKKKPPNEPQDLSLG